jgi:4-hydroxybenzoate polyprenyltransferase
MNLLKVLKISRPHFWLYELGTFAVGALVGFNTETNIFFMLLYGFYFLIPANILIYGINDIFDYETDKLNPKKVEYEELVTPDKHKKLFSWIFFSNVLFLFFLPLFSVKMIISFLLFLFFAIFYSAKPIRAKSKPFLDSFMSAGHYVATGVFAFYLVGGESISFWGVVGAMFWAIAMHAYSAVPDIASDQKAHMATIATFFGRNKTIILCTFLYIFSAILAFQFIGFLALFFGLVYFFFMLLSLYVKKEKDLFSIYKSFSFLNPIVGMVIFFIFLLQKMAL